MNNSQSIKDILNDCIHCGLCLPSCPTYRVSGLEAESPRGRLMIMDYLRQKSKNSEKFDENVLTHLSTCLDCRGCETVCPSGVKYHIALEDTWNIVSNHGKSASIFSGLLLFCIKYPFLLKLLFKSVKIAKLMAIDKIIELFSTHIFQNINSIPSGTKKIKPGIYSGKNPEMGKVGLFTGCIMSEIFPNVHRASVNVLNELGYDVVVPTDDLCCGALHRHAGKLGSAKSLMNTAISEFSEVETIIVNSAGCGAEFKNNHHESNPVFLDFVEFVDKHEFDVSQKIPLNAAWDAPCHLIHGQQINKEPIKVLEKCGVNLVNYDNSDLCCGAAGNYVINHPEHSQQILDKKMDDIEKLNINYLITANPGCQLQLQKGVNQRNIPIKVGHIAEIIDLTIPK